MNRSPRLKTGLLLAALAAQYAWVGVAGALWAEPWPALVFPGFKRVMLTGDRFESTVYRIRVYRAGASASAAPPPLEFSPEEVFIGVPRSQLNGMLRARFRNATSADTLSEAAVNWLAPRVDQLAGRGWLALEIVETPLSLRYEHGRLLPPDPIPGSTPVPTRAVAVALHPDPHRP